MGLASRGAYQQAAQGSWKPRQDMRWDLTAVVGVPEDAAPQHIVSVSPCDLPFMQRLLIASCQMQRKLPGQTHHKSRWGRTTSGSCGQHRPGTSAGEPHKRKGGSDNKLGCIEIRTSEMHIRVR